MTNQTQTLSCLSYIPWEEAIEQIRTKNNDYIVNEAGTAVSAILPFSDRINVVCHMDGKRKTITIEESNNPTVIKIGLFTYVFRLRSKSYLTLSKVN